MKRLVFCVVLVALVAGFAAAQEKTRIRVEENVVIVEEGGRDRGIGFLAVSDDPFLGYGPTFAITPDERGIAFVGEEKGGAAMFIYLPGMKNAVSLPSYGDLSWHSQPMWSPDGGFVTYSQGNRIWLCLSETQDTWIVTEPEEEFVEDIDPEFSPDGERLFFYRGTTFEYSFAGELHSVNLDGSDLLHVPEEDPRYPGEMLGEPEMFDGPEMHDPFIAANMHLIELRSRYFAEDLERHEFERLISYISPWYLLEQLGMMGVLGEPISPDIFNGFFFNGMLMYDDYPNSIPDLESIQEVLEFGVDFFLLEIHFTVRLRDRREVGFTIMFEEETLQFNGPLG